MEWFDYEILSGKDMNAVSCDAARRKWGFSERSLLAQIRKFEKAMVKGDKHGTSLVCALLEDCNFHDICGLLAEGDVEGARVAARNIFKEMRAV